MVPVLVVWQGAALTRNLRVFAFYSLINTVGDGGAWRQEKKSAIYALLMACTS